MTLHFGHIPGFTAGGARLWMQRVSVELGGWLALLHHHHAGRWAAGAAAALLAASLAVHPSPAISLWKQFQANAPVPITLVPHSHAVPVHFL
jgi:hypothetical protein